MTVSVFNHRSQTHKLRMHHHHQQQRRFELVMVHSSHLTEALVHNQVSGNTDRTCSTSCKPPLCGACIPSATPPMPPPAMAIPGNPSHMGQPPAHSSLHITFNPQRVGRFIKPKFRDLVQFTCLTVSAWGGVFSARERKTKESVFSTRTRNKRIHSVLCYIHLRRQTCLEWRACMPLGGPPF